MFEHTRSRHRAHHRGREDHFDIGRQLRDELRRNLRQRVGRQDFDFADLFGGSRRGPFVRRGEVRSLILGALKDRPMHGYELIQELEAQSGGRWRPSAGSVYPTLQQLSDEGLVTGEDVDGRRVFTLTDEGRKAAAESGAAPWADAETGGAAGAGDAGEARGQDLMRQVMELAAAIVQVHKVGSPRARSEAIRIVTDARKQMYRLLSEDEDASPDDAADKPSAATA
jgi:DNA-binding PadR family transcriptional regulator